MINERKGNILNVQEGIIAVLTNERGQMEYGLARQVREKFLTESVYENMQESCRIRGYRGSAPLGRDFLYDARNTPDLRIAPLAARRCIYNREPGKDRLSYKALKKALTSLEYTARRLGERISIPKYLGCGSGGDWDKIYTEILVPIFGDSPVQLDVICYDGGGTFSRKGMEPDASPEMPFAGIRATGGPDMKKRYLNEKGREAKKTAPGDSLLKELMTQVISEGIRDSVSQAGFQCGNVTTGSDAIFFTAEGHNFVLTLAEEESPSKEDSQADGASADI